MVEGKKKKYNKWVSRRWMIAIYLMTLLGGTLLGNNFILLPDNVLIALIVFTSTYLMIFTGYETARKIKREGKENGSK